MTEPHSTKGFVVWDVDGTIADFRGAPRPGIKVVFEVLTRLGFSNVLWSAGGATHANVVAIKAGLDPYVEHYFDKPDYPSSSASAFKILGGFPALIIDDDASEAIEGWPFWHIERFEGDVPILRTTSEGGQHG